MIKSCIVCGKDFNALRSAKCCSVECSYELYKKWDKKEYNRKYHAEHTEETRDRWHEYYSLHCEELRDKDRKYREAHPAVRTCVVCGKSFNARGPQTKCSAECSTAFVQRYQRQYMREYLTTHREEMREQKRKSYAENPNPQREQTRKWAAEHPEEMRERRRKWRAAHREEVRQKQRKWRAAHLKAERERMVVIQNNRRVKLNGVKLTADIVLDLKSEFLGFCPYCWDKIEKGHVDHIVPVSKGGTNERMNLVWVCSTCNEQKGSKSLSEFRLYQEVMAREVRA